MKILVVDDQAANRGLLSFLLEDGGHAVVEAASGEEGISSFKQHVPDMVLMDVMMPGIGGYEAAAEIKAVAQSHVPIIFLTALSDDVSLSKCIESGGDDFLTKPINENLLAAKLLAHERIRDLNCELTKKNAELERYQSVLKQEHELAEYVFESSISWQQDAPNVKRYLSPMGGFSGDLILNAQTVRGTLIVMLGDFTGHGLPAALGALPVSQVFQSLNEKDLSLAELVRQLNKTLYDYLPAHMFCAANVIEVYPDGKLAACWLGGLPDMFLIDSAGLIRRAFASNHMPLGVMPDSSFDDATIEIELRPDESLLAYSDGVTDCCDHTGEMLGEARFEMMFDGSVPRGDLFDSLVARLKYFGKGRPQDDDISLIEVVGAVPCQSNA
ncbi:MAG: PP2C family protein-serine/threonine phosphatase [Pseudomonadales bacterium]